MKKSIKIYSDIINAVAENDSLAFNPNAPLREVNAKIQDAWDSSDSLEDYYDGEKPSEATYEYKSDWLETEFTYNIEAYSKLIHTFITEPIFLKAV